MNLRNEGVVDPWGDLRAGKIFICLVYQEPRFSLFWKYE